MELSYTDFCHRRQADQSYMDKLFIPVQGCLLEVVREQCADFYTNTRLTLQPKILYNTSTLQECSFVFVL